MKFLPIKEIKVGKLRAEPIGPATRWFGEIKVLGRPLAGAEWDMVRAFVRRMKRNDLRLRFGYPLNFDDEATLRRAFDIKAGSGEMIWALDQAATIAGLAHRITVSPAAAELALIVRSDLKRQGVGEFLLRKMLARSARQGITTLGASILRENRAMLELAAKIGYVPRGACGVTIEMMFAAPFLCQPKQATKPARMVSKNTAVP
jgi:GNAT superfamily N-acetyltransferase